MTIEKRAFAGVFSGAASFLLTLVLTYSVVPLLLANWGRDTYGMWLVVMAAASLLATIDMGHQAYVGNQFNQDFVVGPEQLRANLASGLRMTYLLGAVQLVILAILSKAGFVATFLGVSEKAVRDQRLGAVLFILVGIWVLVGSVSGLLGRLYGPMGLYARAQWLSMVQRLFLQYGVVLIVALSGGGIWEFGVAYSVVAGLFALYWYREFRRTLHMTFPWWRGGDWRTAFKNLRGSLVLTANGMLGQAASNGTNLLVASLLNAAVLPSFTTVRTMANTFLQGTTIILQPLVPDLVRFRVKGEWEKLVQTLECAWLAGGVAINLGVITTSPFVPALFTLWTNGQLEFNVPLFYLLALAVVVRAAYAPASIYLAGLNELPVQLHANVAQALCTLGIPLVLHRQLGIAAFGIGVLLGEMASFVLYLRQLFLNREIARLGGVRVIVEHAVVPVLLVGATFVALSVFASATILVAASSAMVLVGYYVWLWLRLPRVVQNRIAGVLSSRWSHF